jgi:hypothetical protein
MKLKKNLLLRNHWANCNETFVENIRRKVLKLKKKKIDEKRAITPRWVIKFTSKCRVGRS